MPELDGQCVVHVAGYGATLTVQRVSAGGVATGGQREECAEAALSATGGPMHRKKGSGLSAQAIADQAFAASPHLVPHEAPIDAGPAPESPVVTAVVVPASACPVPIVLDAPSPRVAAPDSEPIEVIARRVAQAVLTERLDEIDRMEPVLAAVQPVIARALEAQRSRNGRELTEFERDPEKFGRFVRTLARGNYRETACKLTGIAPATIRNWMKAAEDGDARYQAAAHAIRVAEAVAEDESIGDVRSAGKDPRFWAASMTWAERKFPDRWGRRTEDGQAPRVVVQIGVQASDVQVSLVSNGVQAPALVTEGPGVMERTVDE